MRTRSCQLTSPERPQMTCQDKLHGPGEPSHSCHFQVYRTDSPYCLSPSSIRVMVLSKTSMPGVRCLSWFSGRGPMVYQYVRMLSDRPAKHRRKGERAALTRLYYCLTVWRGICLYRESRFQLQLILHLPSTSAKAATFGRRSGGPFVIREVGIRSTRTGFRHSARKSCAEVVALWVYPSPILKFVSISGTRVRLLNFEKFC